MIDRGTDEIDIPASLWFEMIKNIDRQTDSGTTSDKKEEWSPGVIF